MTKPKPDDMPAIHVNIGDDAQVEFLFAVARFIKDYGDQLSTAEILELRRAVHCMRGDAQHEIERRQDMREPRDPRDWGSS